MCSIFGYFTTNPRDEVNTEFLRIMRLSSERGRDSYGFGNHLFLQRYLGNSYTAQLATDCIPHTNIMIGNTRAEPTTEYVKDKTLDDVQPFFGDGWLVSHNGIIANDKELIQEHSLTGMKSKIDSAVLPHLFHRFGMFSGIEKIIGSYAIAATFGESLLLACNYKPIFLKRTHDTFYFASMEKYLRTSWMDNIIQLPAYSLTGIFDDPSYEMPQIEITELNENAGKKVLVICSGGLDSVVTATKYIREGKEVTLLYFSYDCKAENKELRAVCEVSEYLNVPYIVIDIRTAFRNNIFSSLTNDVPINHISDGMSGAEFAHEWVPARNMVFYSLALAFAESNNYDIIALGNNLEESGAYPDNEMIFTELYSKVIPYAINVGKNIRIEQPVGNLMKHEIVKLGKVLGAPLHLTWSCYESGEKHCGLCGPCFMRRKAFVMNGIPEVIKYEHEGELP